MRPCGANSCLHPASAASDTARFAASVAHTKYSENMRIPQEPLAEAANRELWSLHDAARAESECDSLVASESGDVCCEREQILVFQNLSDAHRKIALCGDWHAASAVTRVVAAATVFGAATRDHFFNMLERLSQDSLAIVASYVAVGRSSSGRESFFGRHSRSPTSVGRQSPAHRSFHAQVWKPTPASLGHPHVTDSDNLDCTVLFESSRSRCNDQTRLCCQADGKTNGKGDTTPSGRKRPAYSAYQLFVQYQL